MREYVHGFWKPHKPECLCVLCHDYKRGRWDVVMSWYTEEQRLKRRKKDGQEEASKEKGKWKY